MEDYFHKTIIERNTKSELNSKRHSTDKPIHEIQKTFDKEKTRVFEKFRLCLI